MLQKSAATAVVPFSRCRPWAWGVVWLSLVVTATTFPEGAFAQQSQDSGSWGNFWPNFNTSPNKASEADRESRRAARRKADVRLDRALQSKQVLLSDDTVYALSRAINRYQRIVSRGGWPKISKVKGKWLRLDARDERVALLRKRLQITGDLQQRTAKNAWTFDGQVQAALRRFQIRHGIRPKGVVDTRTLRALNVSAEVRLGQLRLNMTRLRDLLDHRAAMKAEGHNRYVLVNAASYELQAVRDGRLELSSKVVVGKPSTQTPTIHAKIRGLNFFPYWRVPDSIANRALIPTLIKDPGYLQRERIRVLDDWGGNEIDPSTIDWPNARNLGVKFRQDPGERNALGVVRVNMPNDEIIYLHDTPLKRLFNSSTRAFSAGCVRVQKVIDLVNWLAQDEPDWGRGRVRQVLDNRISEDVKFKKSVPVTLAYITAWGTENGRAQFRADIYGRDGISVLLAANHKIPVDAVKLSP